MSSPHNILESFIVLLGPLLSRAHYRYIDSTPAQLNSQCPGQIQAYTKLWDEFYYYSRNTTDSLPVQVFDIKPY